MARKRTGLSNRFRSGRSKYSAEAKSKSGDRYGAWVNGKQTTPDIVTGHAHMWPKTNYSGVPTFKLRPEYAR